MKKKDPAKIIKEEIDNFFDSQEVDVFQPVPKSVYLKKVVQGKLVQAKPVGDLIQGKATILKTGNKHFVIQNPVPQKLPPIRPMPKVYRQDDDDEIITNPVIIVVLSEKRPIDLELLGTNYDFNTLPYFQVVEDIYVPNNIYKLWK
jgi:hypothetical protein